MKSTGYVENINGKELVEKLDVSSLIRQMYKNKEDNNDNEYLNDQELQEIIKQSQLLELKFLDFNDCKWLEWLNKESIEQKNIRRKNNIIAPWFLESYEQKLKELTDFKSLQHYTYCDNGYIPQYYYNYYLNQIKYKLLSSFYYDNKKKDRYWDFVMCSPVMQEVLSKLIILSDEEYNKYIQSITPSFLEQKLTAPDLESGAVTCIILCCITFIFNFFWVYWIIIWIGYYFWRKEQIIKFNPQHFRKEN